MLDRYRARDGFRVIRTDTAGQVRSPADYWPADVGGRIGARVGWTTGGGGGLVAIGALCGPGNPGRDDPPDWPAGVLTGATVGWAGEDPDDWAGGWAGGREKGVGAGGVGPWMAGIWTVGNGAACPPGGGLGGTPSTPPGPGGISILGSGVGESAT